MTETGIRPPHYRLPATAQLGRVRLAVSNLARSVAFYRDVIGLSVHESTGLLAYLGPKGSDEVLIELEELPGVKPVRERSRLGLYHTAFLLPTRESLASFIHHLNNLGVRFGSSDHLISEALYLVDPDGLQVEVYADRSRQSWEYNAGELLTGVNPLRFEDLPQIEVNSWKGAPIGTSIGHVHLYVGDLETAKNFYCSALGFDITVWTYPGALFTSAGGYHHHIGLNTWAAGSPPASDQDARLLYWQLVLPDAMEVERVTASLSNAGFSSLVDPWGIKLLLTSKSG